MKKSDVLEMYYWQQKQRKIWKNAEIYPGANKN